MSANQHVKYNVPKNCAICGNNSDSDSGSFAYRTSDANTSVALGLLGIFVIGVFFLSKKKKWLVSNR